MFYFQIVGETKHILPFLPEKFCRSLPRQRQGTIRAEIFRIFPRAEKRTGTFENLREKDIWEKNQAQRKVFKLESLNSCSFFSKQTFRFRLKQPLSFRFDHAATWPEHFFFVWFVSLLYFAFLEAFAFKRQSNRFPPDGSRTEEQSRKRENNGETILL